MPRNASSRITAEITGIDRMGTALYRNAHEDQTPRFWTAPWMDAAAFLTSFVHVDRSDIGDLLSCAHGAPFISSSRRWGWHGRGTRWAPLERGRAVESSPEGLEGPLAHNSRDGRRGRRPEPRGDRGRTAAGGRRTDGQDAPARALHWVRADRVRHPRRGGPQRAKGAGERGSPREGR